MWLLAIKEIDFTDSSYSFFKDYLGNDLEYILDNKLAYEVYSSFYLKKVGAVVRLPIDHHRDQIEGDHFMKLHFDPEIMAYELKNLHMLHNLVSEYIDEISHTAKKDMLNAYREPFVSEVGCILLEYN